MLTDRDSSVLVLVEYISFSCVMYLDKKIGKIHTYSILQSFAHFSQPLRQGAHAQATGGFKCLFVAMTLLVSYISPKIQVTKLEQSERGP